MLAKSKARSGLPTFMVILTGIFGSVSSSICRMSGYLHLIVPRTRFRLLRGADSLSEYRFNTGAARHLFCRRCGVKSFYVPRSNPDGYSVNVRCLDQSTLEHIEIEPFDDRERAAAEARLRERSRA